MDKIFRTAALELQTLDHKQVVKVAGLIRRLKNWFKRQSDPAYNQTVQKLHQDTTQVQGTLAALNKEIDLLQAAIKDGELEVYNTTLNNVKELSSKLWSEIKQTSEDSRDYYTLQDMEVPGFQEWFKKYLPKGYDLDLGTIYNKPLKEVKWYSNLAPQEIYLREDGAQKFLFAEVKKTLVRDSFASPEEADKLLSNKDGFIKEFKNAIINGVLIMADVKKPSQEISKHLGGSTEIQVTTAPFTIPGSDIVIQAKVDLIDLSTTKSSRSKLSLKRTHYVTALGRNKTQNQKIVNKKFALSQEVPIKQTQLSDQQFAQVLREGYKMAFGQDPSAETLAAGWAQVILEAGRPVKLLDNNVGNVKATDDWIKSGKSYFMVPTSEFTQEGKKYNTDAKWRAYPTPEEGAAGYWKVLNNNHKAAMDWMAAGDPKSAGITLGVGEYFTANIPKYTAGMESLYKEFMQKIAPQLPALNSRPIISSQEKPEMKSWRGDYSKEEKEAILGKKFKGSEGVDLTNVDSLITELYADDAGPMEKLVKQAILQEKLPLTRSLIVIKGEASREDKLQYAKTASYILNRFIDAVLTVHAQDQNVEMQCCVLGSNLVTTQAVQALCDCVSDGLMAKKGIKLEAMVVPGFQSQYQEANIEDMYTNLETM